MALLPYFPNSRRRSSICFIARGDGFAWPFSQRFTEVKVTPNFAAPESCPVAHAMTALNCSDPFSLARHRISTSYSSIALSIKSFILESPIGICQRINHSFNGHLQAGEFLLHIQAALSPRFSANNLVWHQIFASRAITVVTP